MLTSPPPLHSPLGKPTNTSFSVLKELHPGAAPAKPYRKQKWATAPAAQSSPTLPSPPTYEAGDYVEAKCTGTSLWQQSGPWAPRYLAAHHYYNLYGALSTHWDWAASTLDLNAPPPLSLSKLQEKSPDSNASQKPLR